MAKRHFLQAKLQSEERACATGKCMFFLAPVVNSGINKHVCLHTDWDSVTAQGEIYLSVEKRSWQQHHHSSLFHCSCSDVKEEDYFPTLAGATLKSHIRSVDSSSDDMMRLPVVVISDTATIVDVANDKQQGVPRDWSIQFLQRMFGETKGLYNTKPFKKAMPCEMT